MIINSKYNKVFTSNDLTKKKYNEIYSLAEKLRDIKNAISHDIADNIYFYSQLNDFEFRKHLEKEYTKFKLSSNFYRALYKDLQTSYSNKFDMMKTKMGFKVNRIYKTVYYKKNTNKHKKGDVKGVVYHKESTPLCKVLSFLAKYPMDDYRAYINKKLSDPNTESGKVNFYNTILYYLETRGEERLIRLANMKRINIINRYNKPIEFSSLNFRGRTRTTNIISYNTNKKSNKKAFITLSWLERGKSMIIPVRYSKDHYGDIEKYQKSSPDYEYTITFPKTGKININFSINGTRNIPTNQENINGYVGVDVNVKHNLFTLSNGFSYDYDRELLEKICIELAKNDELKGIFDKKNKGNKDAIFKLGKLKDKKLKSLRRNLKHSIERLISKMCRDMINEGFNHAIFENLDNSFGANFGTSNGINFNRVVKELKLSSLKDTFGLISRKYNIAVSKVQPDYTSKMCSKCNNIDDKNRKTQEHFICTSCGYKNNADINAAINIKNRVVETVFLNLVKQDELLKTFKPEKISREKLKLFFINSFPFNE